MSNLLHVHPGQTVEIIELTNSGSMRRRMLDMGLTRGARATCLYKSPAGDPTAYFIRGAVIALRAEEAADVRVMGI